MNHSLALWGLAALLGLGTIPLLSVLFQYVSLELEDEMVLVLTRFGKVVKILKEPGLHWWFGKNLPWNKVHLVSTKRDFRHYDQIHVNDCRGTTILIDLWVELRINSPEKSLFQVENWEKSLQSILTCSATSILGTFEFSQILSNRSELGRTLKDDIQGEISRWGLEINLVFISRLSLLPDVSQQLFDAVAAQLEKAKVDIEEIGRLEVSLLEAETSAKVAALEAEARGQYSLAVGRSYSRLKSNAKILSAYAQLYELSLLKPHRTVAFHGFQDQGLKAVEALMSTPHLAGELNSSMAYAGHSLSGSGELSGI